MKHGEKRINKKTPRIRITSSSGNVFRDLALPHPEEDMAKAALAGRLCKLISRRRLSQVEAASLLGLDQPKVSSLLHGRLAGFSTDRLLRLLNKLGHDVDIVVRMTARRAPPAATRVVSA